MILAAVDPIGVAGGVSLAGALVTCTTLMLRRTKDTEERVDQATAAQIALLTALAEQYRTERDQAQRERDDARIVQQAGWAEVERQRIEFEARLSAQAVEHERRVEALRARPPEDPS